MSLLRNPFFREAYRFRNEGGGAFMMILTDYLCLSLSDHLLIAGMKELNK